MKEKNKNRIVKVIRWGELPYKMIKFLIFTMCFCIGIATIFATFPEDNPATKLMYFILATGLSIWILENNLKIVFRIVNLTKQKKENDGSDSKGNQNN